MVAYAGQVPMILAPALAAAVVIAVVMAVADVSLVSLEEPVPLVIPVVPRTPVLRPDRDANTPALPAQPYFPAVHCVSSAVRLVLAMTLGLNAQPIARSVHVEIEVCVLAFPAFVVPLGQAVRPNAAVGPVVTALPAASNTAPVAEETPEQ